MMKKATREEHVAVTSVVWDINKCPVPSDCDPRVARPIIRRILCDNDYCGPLTVIAFGQLAKVSEKILKALFSSGISVANIDPKEKLTYLENFADKNPPPANFMVMSDRPRLSKNLRSLDCQPFSYSSFVSLMIEEGEDSESLVTQKGELALWDCFVCARDPPGESFDSLIKHLHSEEHHELLLARSTVNWEAVKSSCPTFVFWDINSCPVPSGFDASLVGPCIKRFLKKQGYGPIVVVAIGELSEVPLRTLAKVHGSGVNLEEVPYGPWGAYKVIFDHSKGPGPLRNLMVISNARIFAEQPLSLQTECNFLKPYPCDSLQIFLEDSGDMYSCSETPRFHFCYCKVCHHYPSPFQSEGFQGFAMHLLDKHHQQKKWELLPISNQVRRWNAPKGEPLEETLSSVYWDIKTCPVPPEFDPRRVGPCIKQFLEKKGCSGPLTITAVGVLTDFPDDILSGLYSSGISFNNIPYRLGFMSTTCDLVSQFTCMYPPPANIMVISDGEHFFSKLPREQRLGYTIVEPVPFDSLQSLLLADSGEVEEDKSSEASWICGVCDLDLVGQGFENFTTHVTSWRHKRKLFDWLPEDARFRFPENALDLVKVQDMLM